MLIACGNAQNEVKTSYSNFSMLNFRVDTLRISLDNKTEESFEVFSKYSKDDSDFLIFYDAYNHRLISVDLEKSEVGKTINLELNGPKGVGPIEGIHYENEDSVFIYERGRIKILDSSGTPYISYNLLNLKTPNDKEVGFLYTNYFFKLLYNNQHKCLYLNNIFKGNRNLALKNPLVAVLNLPGGELEFLDINYSHYIQENQGRFGYQFNINFDDLNGSNLLYTFPVEDNIYAYNQDDKKTINYKLISEYTPSFVEPLSSMGDRDQARINFVESPYYYGVFNDNQRGLNFRIHREGKPFNLGEDVFNSITDVNFFITIMDSKFQYIQEIELPRNVYLQYSWFELNGSLYLNASNQNYNQSKEGVMEIHKFSFY